MNKKAIRITESDLHRIVKESVQKIINEIGDTPRGQRALGAVAARSIHRMHNALDDDQPEEAAYWDNVANDAARIGHNNVNPDWDEETEYFDDGVDYWHDNLRQYESKNIKKDLIRLTESDLYRIVKESIDEIAKEGQEPKYNVGDYVRVHFKGEYTPITMRITRIKPIKGYGFYYDGVSNGQWHGAGEDDIDFKYDVIDDGNGGEILSPPQGVISGYRPSVKESKEGYNYIMSVRNNPIFQQELKKAWNKEIKTNTNPDYDTFEHRFITIFLNKQMKNDADAYDRHLRDIGR